MKYNTEKQENRITDRNGREIRPGDVVKISDAYFKNDNGLYFVENAPGRASWRGSDLSLKKISKSGKISTAKYSLAFWPLKCFVSSWEKRTAGNAWNAEHAKIELSSVADVSEIVAYFREKAESSIEQADREARDFGQDSENVAALRRYAEEYEATAARLISEKLPDGYTEPQPEPADNIPHFVQNGMKINGKLYSGRYSEYDRDDGAVVIYMRDFTETPAASGIEISNDSDSMSDYFERDTVTVRPDSPYYAEAVKARAAALIRYAKNAVKHAERNFEKKKGTSYEIYYKNELDRRRERLEKLLAQSEETAAAPAENKNFEMQKPSPADSQESPELSPVIVSKSGDGYIVGRMADGEALRLGSFRSFEEAQIFARRICEYSQPPKKPQPAANPQNNEIKQPETAKASQSAEVPSPASPESGEVRQKNIETQQPKPLYFPIDEKAAKLAHEMMSLNDYREGSLTAEYTALVNDAYDLADKISKVKPRQAEKARQIAETYARKLAENLNEASRIGARCPSVLITGASNFPTRKKEKQNAAFDRNFERYEELQGCFERLHGLLCSAEVIRSDEADAAEELENKLAKLNAEQEKMKSVNAFYRKNKTLDGCPALSDSEIKKLKNEMQQGFHLADSPYPPFELSNNGAEIRRIKERIESLKKLKDEASGAKEYEDLGLTVSENTEIMRLQFRFEEIPSPEIREIMKRNAFKWSPKNGCWQRQLTENARLAGKKIIEQLKKSAG